LKQYFKEIVLLLGDESRKIPWMILLFLCSSFLDLAGLGLIGPYVALAITPSSITEWHLYNFLEFYGIPHDQNIILTWLGLILVGVFMLKSILVIYINRTIIKFSTSQETRIKSFLMQAYQQMSYILYLERNSAEYIQAIQSYTTSFGTVLQTILKTVSDVLVAIAILAMLAWTNGPALGLMIFLLGLMVFGYDRLFRNKIHDYGRIMNESSILTTKGIHEGIEGLKEIRILGKEHKFYKMVRSGSSEYAKYFVKSQVIATSPRLLLESMLVIFMVTLVVVSIQLGDNLQALAPTLGIFGFAALRLMPSANTLSTSLLNIRFNRYAISQLFADFISLNEGRHSNKVITTVFNNVDYFRELKIHDVHFTYPNTKYPALKEVTFNIRAGDSIGLTGPSGSGKTTMVDVLLGLLAPQKGEIFFNGKCLSESLIEWRSQIAYLPQQVFLIDSSFRQNIALGMEVGEIDDVQLHKAISQARLNELVEQLPDGVETILGERGVRLSGGQRQRVALARAFFHGRNILIMDEATSSLDNETEAEIVDEIKQFKGEKTMIVIAHRLTTIEECDYIYQFDHGRIVRQGIPNEIIGKL